MEPILQRFGDVTIQRLEKPKEPKMGLHNDNVALTQPPTSIEKESYPSGVEEETNSDELNSVNLKRTYPGSQVSLKKIKLDNSSVTISETSAKKHITEPEKDLVNKVTNELPDNYSETEMSDYESESDVETESEIVDKGDKEEDEPDTNVSFLDNLVEDPDPFIPPESEIAKPVEGNPPENDDYDFDIKEKLKEMGEISFQTVKKGQKPKKLEVATENEVVVTPARKPGATDEDNIGERKGLNLRKNIREVMDETKLDESTLAAQRQEMERLQRVQEQQRLLRELQRQAAQERMQNKVISLLQGNNLSKPGTSNTTRIGNTVLVKLPNGQTRPINKLPKRSFDLVRLPKGGSNSSGPMSARSQRNFLQMHQHQAHLQHQQLLRRQGANLTPSVSIAPVTKRPTPPMARRLSDSDGEDDIRRSKLKEPVTTIDISSDEDCIVVSEPECENDDTEDDPSNSGMHTNDEFNQPDDQGRVVVNIGHPENEPDIFLAPQIARVIKPHQIGGVRFLYDNVIESTGRFESSAGFGCILAHSMGLGKTLQVICFSDIFLRHTPAKTILCIMPINTLQNWLAEFNMWLPTEEAVANNALNGNGEIRPRNFNLHVLNDSHKTLIAKAKVIHSWKVGGGVLLIGYEQFRLLSLKKHPKSRRKPHLVEPQDDDKNKALFEDIHEALVRPGPDLVICDEGHRIKNSHASISQALKQMRTKRRVVLTGYPLQNNLMEYWCMVDFVRPNYLGSKTEFCNMFERPIMNGQCIDSTETDIKLMRYRAHVLHSLLVGFVQRRSHSVLQTTLPQKEEYVLLVRMLPFQRKLYETFMDEVVRSQTVPNPLKAFAVCCKIWNHPDVLYNFLKKRARGDAIDIDLEEVASTAGTPTESKPKKQPPKRRNQARSKNGVKPAASVTPYNSSTETNPSIVSGNTCLSVPTPTPPIPSTNFTNNPLQQNKNEFSNNYTNQSYPQQTFYNQNQNNYQNETSPSQQRHFANFSHESNNSFINNVSENSHFPQNNFNQSSQQYHHHYEQPSTGNYQYSNQQYFENYQQGDYFNSQSQQQQQYNPNFSSNNANQSWVVKRDDKTLISTTIKNENSCESKPKINIISDIKLPSTPLFHSTSSSDKKINILSDIKLEPKINDIDDKNDIKPEIKKLIKDELKIDEEESKLENPLNKLNVKDIKEDTGIPYDWAIELLKDYIPGCIENSAKMEILFCIIRESIALGDRLLVFSQSLITLDLIEQFLQMNTVPGDTVKWSRGTSYFRLDGSTSALEREKLINEFNSNSKIHLFLVSTRAGSLGINLIGANRVVVLDASWNPCHDTQAVCRVYRYGQRKPCFVYRLVVDNCMEKKIYDRQINKQGMSDRVVDECNPDAHLTMKDVSTLCWDEKTDEGEEKEWLHVKDNYIDVVLQKVIEKHGRRLNKEPFQHESLLVDRKEKQLSQQEKRLAKKGYEREKQAARQPTYNLLGAGRGHRPIASVRPMQQGNERSSRWIPAEHWQRQGMTAQEMTLPLDVVIPTNQPEKGNIVLKAGQKVLVLKSPKGVYMQLESGKIVAIKTAIKVKGKAEDNNDPTKLINKPNTPQTIKVNPSLSSSSSSITPQKRIIPPFRPGITKMNVRSIRQSVPNLVTRIQSIRRDNSRTFQMANEQTVKLPTQKDTAEIIPSSSSDEEHVSKNMDTISLAGQDDSNDIEKTFSMLKKNISIKRINQARPESKHSSPALQRLEQTATSVINDNTPFQESLDNITSSYKDDTLEDDQISEAKPSQTSTSDLSNQSDEITYVSEQSALPASSSTLSQPQLQSQSQLQRQQHYPANEVKTENPDYYNNYNFYNVQPQYVQPQPTATSAQTYSFPPQPAYDIIGGYQQQQQQQPPPQTIVQPPPPAQYNYGYQAYPAPAPPPPPPAASVATAVPQNFVPAPPPPQVGYEYNQAPPPQPIFAGYHNPYPPQQYPTQHPQPPQPPPPPPQGMYQTLPTVVQANPTPIYSDQYQYTAASSSSQPYYPNT